MRKFSKLQEFGVKGYFYLLKTECVKMFNVFAFSDNLSAENSKLSADSGNRGSHLFGCMRLTDPVHQALKKA